MLLHRLFLHWGRNAGRRAACAPSWGAPACLDPAFPWESMTPCSDAHASTSEKEEEVRGVGLRFTLVQAARHR